jgi:hypothetical protein
MKLHEGSKKVKVSVKKHKKLKMSIEIQTREADRGIKNSLKIGWK